jgi:hypothetical protein
MAWAGAEYLSIVLPQIAFTDVRAPLYRRASPAPVSPSAWIATETGSIFRAYWLSGLGQFVNGGFLIATPLVIGQFANERGVGLYSMPFALSASINSVVAVSLGLVLQPVFAQMSGDYDRQAAAFLRACRTIAAIAIPVCPLQAALAPTAFHVFLPERSMGAIAMTQVLCVGQAFCFPVNPAMGLPKGARALRSVLRLAGGAATSGAHDYVRRRIPRARPRCPCRACRGSFMPGCVQPVRRLALHSASQVGRRRDPLHLLGLTLASAIAIGPTYFACESFLSSGTAQDWTELVAIPAVAALTYPTLLRIFAPDLQQELSSIVRSIVGRLRVPGITAGRQ